ncbi:hypothetical protein F5I97DRAFT_1862131 [Phlebopus sp. FC_14]|nr:hypothetical protein F5I97DRAFT_1862131 [Phlebopus sp. FC_14]
MIVPKRVQRSPPLISYPVPSELAPDTSFSPLVSPPNTPPRGHKHSLSKPIAWLSRSTSSTSTHSPPQAASKPMRISEPKFDNSLEIFNIKRRGALGSGATIVRTPQEALACPGQLFGSADQQAEAHEEIILEEEDEGRTLPLLPDSPPLPSLPSSDLPRPPTQLDVPSHFHSTHSPALRDLVPSPCPTHPLPPLLSSANYSSSKGGLRSSSSSDCPPPVSMQTAHFVSTPPQTQPPFQAILLSSIPDSAIDPTKIVVTLETCSMTYRTSLKSLISRPSYLADYVTSLLRAESETASVYSHSSDASIVQQNNNFNAVFHDHLTSLGCLSRSSSSIHVFLDRPSAPYVHVLSYLRSIPGTQEHPESLPFAVQLCSGSRSRLEALLELRDEARYLGLEALHKLCCDEINQRHSVAAMAHTRCASRGSEASIHSLHTVIEQAQPSISDASPGPAVRAGLGSPKRLRSSLRQRSTSRTRNKVGSTSAPAGWI